MPIYEYDCDACGCRFERIQHITRREADTADASVVCPDCGATSVHRIVSTFMVNSDGVRQLHLRAGGRAAGQVAREKEQADIDYLKSHQH